MSDCANSSLVMNLGAVLAGFVNLIWFNTAVFTAILETSTVRHAFQLWIPCGTAAAIMALIANTYPKYPIKYAPIVRCGITASLGAGCMWLTVRRLSSRHHTDQRPYVLLGCIVTVTAEYARGIIQIQNNTIITLRTTSQFQAYYSFGEWLAGFVPLSLVLLGTMRDVMNLNDRLTVIKQLYITCGISMMLYVASYVAYFRGSESGNQVLDQLGNLESTTQKCVSEGHTSTRTSTAHLLWQNSLRHHIPLAEAVCMVCSLFPFYSSLGEGHLKATAFHRVLIILPMTIGDLIMRFGADIPFGKKHLPQIFKPILGRCWLIRYGRMVFALCFDHANSLCTRFLVMTALSGFNVAVTWSSLSTMKSSTQILTNQRPLPERLLLINVLISMHVGALLGQLSVIL